VGIKKSLTECGNWDVAAQLLFWEYLFQIFGILSLQCAEGPEERTRWIEMMRKSIERQNYDFFY